MLFNKLFSIFADGCRSLTVIDMSTLSQCSVSSEPDARYPKNTSSFSCPADCFQLALRLLRQREIKISWLLSARYPFTIFFSSYFSFLFFHFFSFSLTHLLTFEDEIEAMLFLKPLGDKDMVDFFPKVWWEKGEKLNPPCDSKEEMERHRDQVGAALHHLEALQSDLFHCFLQDDFSSEKLDDVSPSTFVLFWLRGFLHKNQGYLRDVPPPGLSDPSVLVNILFIILRALQPYLSDPASVGKVDFVMYTDDDKPNTLDFFDLPRIGGTLSHLKKSRFASSFCKKQTNKQTKTNSSHSYRTRPAPPQESPEGEGEGVSNSDSDMDFSSVREQATQLILEALNGGPLPFKISPRRPVEPPSY